MMAGLPPYIPSSKHETGIIQFEFKIKYREALTSHWTLQECLSQSINDALHHRGHPHLQLTTTQIIIASLDHKPNEMRPKSLFIECNFRCKVMQRDIFIEALQYAHDSRNISSRFAKEAFIKQSKVGLKQFNIKWTDAQIIDTSIVDSAFKNYKIYNRSRSSKKKGDDDNKPNDQSDDHNALNEVNKERVQNKDRVHNKMNEKLHLNSNSKNLQMDPFYAIDLHDLVDSHSVCRYLGQFPEHKLSILCSSENDHEHNTKHESIETITNHNQYSNDDDVYFCSVLSAMVYQMQITGHFFLDSFTHSDFQYFVKCSLSTFDSKSGSNDDEYETEWIWLILDRAIRYSNAPKTKSQSKSEEEMSTESVTISTKITSDTDCPSTKTTETKTTKITTINIPWIPSSWKRHDILQHELLRRKSVMSSSESAITALSTSSESPSDGFEFINYDEKEMVSASSMIHGQTLSDPMDYRPSPSVGGMAMGLIVPTVQEQESRARSMDFGLRSPRQRISPLMSSTALANDGYDGCKLESPKYLRKSTDQILNILPTDSNHMAILDWD